MRTHLPRTRRITLVCFCESKSVYLLPAGKVPAPLCPAHRAQGFREAVSEQHTQKHFQACQRKKDSLELGTKPLPPDIGPQEWGSRSQSTREDAYPRDNCMKKIWRSCYLFGTKSFSGDRKTCCISSCWLVWANPAIDESLASGHPPLGRFHLQWPG